MLLYKDAQPLTIPFLYRPQDMSEKPSVLFIVRPPGGTEGLLGSLWVVASWLVDVALTCGARFTAPLDARGLSCCQRLA